MIRPVVLFGRSVAQHARETGVAARTIARKAKNFASAGMASLFPEPSTLPRQSFPEEMRQAILALKAEHPAFRPNELATICFVRFGRRPSAHTVTKILAEGPLPTSTTRRFTPYAEIADPIERRLAVVTLHAESWNIASIAAYLQTNRPRVYEILQRWIAEGVAGLANKPHTRKQRVLKTDLKAINEVRRLQENPELGEFRMHAALKQLGIELSPRTCGRILALNRKIYGLDRPKRAPHVAKATTWEELQKIHERWVADYNAQVHWAHRKREDQRHSPQEVLGWVTGKSWTVEELQQIFRLARGERRVKAAGYVRYRHWDMYGERGLAHQRVAVWLAAEAPVLTLAYRENPLAQYTVVREADQRSLKDVTVLRLLDTDLRSPQPLLDELNSVEWRLALPRPRPAPRRRSLHKNVQQFSFLDQNPTGEQ